MHIQKLPAMIMIGAIFGASSLQAQSTDNDIQAKAREALRQKMDEMNGRAVPSTPYTTVAPTPPAPPIVPAQPQEPVVLISPVPPTPSPAPPMVTAPPSAGLDLQTQALEAMRQKKAELDARERGTAASETPTPVVTPAPSFTKPSRMNEQPQNATYPSLIPGSKEQRLADLLQQYKTDSITPSEYHLQRAKIIAEP